MRPRFEVLQKTGNVQIGMPWFDVGRAGSSVNWKHRGADLLQEELCNLVQNIFLAPEKAPPCEVAAFCGVDNSEGSSWVSARVGEALAECASGTVCLVDANLQSPSLHQHFRVDNGKGLFQVLQEARPAHTIARRVWGSKLWLITAGTANDMDESFPPGRLRECVSDLHSRFDYVLFDTPPVNFCGDALSIGRLAHGLILVVDGHSTRQESRLAKQSLETAKVSMLGVVFNRRTRPAGEAFYQTR